MAYHELTASVLMSLGYKPLIDFQCGKNTDGSGVSLAWQHADAKPTEENIAATAASPEFAAWLDKRTDPTKNRRRIAKEFLQSNDPDKVMLRGILKVLFQSLAEVRTKAGLTNRTFQQAMQDVAAAIDAGLGEI